MDDPMLMDADPAENGNPYFEDDAGPAFDIGPEVLGDRPGHDADDGLEGLAMPEDMEIDEALLDQFKPVARELNLAPESAQRLVDMYSEAVRANSAAARDQLIERNREWLDEIKHDPKFGGGRFQENLSLARRAIERYGGAPLRAAFNATGLGNHPEIVRAFMRIGRLISEDQVVQSGERSVGGERSIAERLYGD